MQFLLETLSTLNLHDLFDRELDLGRVEYCTKSRELVFETWPTCRCDLW